MKKNFVLYIISISVLLFVLTGCSGNKESNSNSFEFNSLVEKAISVQYGNKNIKEKEVFSENYIVKIPNEESFFKEDMNPYKILSSNIEEVISESDEEMVVSVRISDKKGEYFQVLHIIKINESYYIDNIEYDI